MRRTTLIIACLCVGWTVKAQDSLKTVQLDDVVITGTKSAIPVEKSGKSIYKISRQDIENSPGKTVADLLNETPGVQMDGNFGPLGTNIGYFVRGASSKRTLILIDGVPFNDPSGIDQTYDLRLLDLSQVESIEILKGGLSSLYGTGAAAGVINITLREAQDEFSGRAGISYGSFNSVRPKVSVGGATGDLKYQFSGSYTSADGFSVAEDESGSGNFDDDGFNGYNILGKLGYDFSDAFDLGLTLAVDDFDADFDGGAFADGDHTSEYQQVRIGLSPIVQIGSGKLQGNLFYSKLDRLFNSPDFFDPAARFIDEYKGDIVQADLVWTQNLSPSVRIVGGLNYQKQVYSQPAVDETEFNWVDPNATLIYELNNFNLQLGSRLNVHSEYGSQLVYNINPSYLIDLQGYSSLKVFGSFGTSYITPSLYQILGPFGEEDLEAEESVSLELGASMYLPNVTINAAFFDREDSNLIAFDNGSFQYFNAESDFNVNGLELDVDASLTEVLRVSANYSYLNAKDDQEIFRIPSHMYGIALLYTPITDLLVRVNYNRQGDRTQAFFNSTTFATEVVETEAFGLVDLSARYQFGAFTVSGAVNNALDEDYVAIVGFNSVGRNYNLGISYDF